MKNTRASKPKNSLADVVLKLPGAISTNNKFGRCLKKLDSHSAEAILGGKEKGNIPNQIVSIIKLTFVKW